MSPADAHSLVAYHNSVKLNTLAVPKINRRVGAHSNGGSRNRLTGILADAPPKFIKISLIRHCFRGRKYRKAVFACQWIFDIKKQGLAIRLGKEGGGRSFEKSAHRVVESPGKRTFDVVIGNKGQTPFLELLILMVLPERVWVTTTGSGWVRMEIRHQGAIRRDSSRVEEETAAWKTGCCMRSCLASSSRG